MATVEKAKMNSNAVEDSLARVFFAADSEAAINEQINHEYTMSYVYHAVSLPPVSLAVLLACIDLGNALHEGNIQQSQPHCRLLVCACVKNLAGSLVPVECGF